VATKDLDTRWHDRLATWRERPSALDEEPHSERFHFTRGAEPWIVFMRGYPGIRLPDWIAIDIPNNQIRRFVEIDQSDLLDDLEGKRPAPYQEDLHQRWSDPAAREPQGAFADRYRDTGGLSLPFIIKNAQIPVYGVSENPFGLRLYSTKYSFESRGPDGVTLTFVSPGPVDPQVVASFDALRVGIRTLAAA